MGPDDGGAAGEPGSTTAGATSTSPNRRAPAASVASSRCTAAASGPTASNAAIAASGRVARSAGGTVPPRTAAMPTQSTRIAHAPVRTEAVTVAPARIVVSRAVTPSIAMDACRNEARCAPSRSSAARSATPRTPSSARAVASDRYAIRSPAGPRDTRRMTVGTTMPPARAKTSSSTPAVGSIAPRRTAAKASAAAAATGGTATPANASSSVPMSAVIRASRSPDRTARSRAGASGSIEAKNHERRSASTRNVPAWTTIRSRYRATERPIASTRTAVMASARSATLEVVWARLIRKADTATSPTLATTATAATPPPKRSHHGRLAASPSTRRSVIGRPARVRAR